jgi:hypothetical protein
MSLSISKQEDDFYGKNILIIVSVVLCKVVDNKDLVDIRSGLNPFHQKT